MSVGHAGVSGPRRPGHGLPRNSTTHRPTGCAGSSSRFRHKKLAWSQPWWWSSSGSSWPSSVPDIAPAGLEQTFPSYTAPRRWHHLLGTDAIGHDELSQLLFAMRTSVFAAGFAAILGAVLGTLVGVISGYAGGWVDWATGRCIDALLSFPGLLLIIALIGVFGAGLYPAMIALGISFVGWLRPTGARRGPRRTPTRASWRPPRSPGFHRTGSSASTSSRPSFPRSSCSSA